MESLMKPVTLTQDAVRVLDEIRAGADNALYGAGPDVSEELFAKQVVSLVEGAGLPVLQTMHYRWYLREIARLWRTRKGRDLAFHLELCIRKWVGLGLEPRTLQFLVCEAHERLKGKSKVQSGNDECGAESAADTRACHSELVEESRPVETPPSASGRHSVSSATSADVRSDHSSSRSLDPSIPSEPNAERTARPGPLGSSSTNDGTLPGIMAGPRPPADSSTGPLESSNPGAQS